MKHFEKEIFKVDNLSITRLYKKNIYSDLVFLHGGPGYNAGALEYLIENEKLFDSLKHNLILYDQRGCGKSAETNHGEVTHQDNLDDLNRIYTFFINEKKLLITGIIGHSYGGKLLYDYYKRYKPQTGLIFVGIASNMLIPRMNSMMIDLAYLKTKNKMQYQKILSEITDLSLENLWKLTEDLDFLVRDNENRPYLYWANVEWLEKFQYASKKVNLPINMNILTSARKDIYLNQDNLEVSIEKLEVPCLWINGVHDLIMGANQKVFEKKSNTIYFYKSSHYPHIEENEKFCEIINDFIK